MTTVLGNADAVLGNTSGLVVGATGSQQLTILKASCYNDDSVARTVIINRVASGGAASAANQIVGNGTFSIPSKGSAVLPIAGQTLINNQGLYGQADTGAVVTISVSFAYIS